MPGTVATKGGIAEANEHLRQLYARIDELETQLQAQIIYREQLTNLQNDNFEMKEMVHRLQINNQELVNYARERTNDIARLQSENKQLVEIVSDLANQRSAVDEWISLTNRATHTVNQLISSKNSKFKTVKQSNYVNNHVSANELNGSVVGSAKSTTSLRTNGVTETNSKKSLRQNSRSESRTEVQANNSSVIHVEMHENENGCN